METIYYTMLIIGVLGALYLCLLAYEKIIDHLIEKKRKRNEDFNYDINDDLNEKVFGDLL